MIIRQALACVCLYFHTVGGKRRAMSWRDILPTIRWITNNGNFLFKAKCVRCSRELQAEHFWHHFYLFYLLLTTFLHTHIYFPIFLLQYSLHMLYLASIVSIRKPTLLPFRSIFTCFFFQTNQMYSKLVINSIRNILKKWKR